MIFRVWDGSQGFILVAFGLLELFIPLRPDKIWFHDNLRSPTRLTVGVVERGVFGRPSSTVQEWTTDRLCLLPKKMQAKEMRTISGVADAHSLIFLDDKTRQT